MITSLKIGDSFTAPGSGRRMKVVNIWVENKLTTVEMDDSMFGFQIRPAYVVMDFLTRAGYKKDIAAT